MSVIWKGSTALRETPRQSLDETFERNTQEYEYEGTYAACLANRPQRGSFFKNTGYTITKVHLERLPGGRGRLTLTTDFLNYIPSPPPLPPNTNYEIEWCREEKDLLLHPIFQDGGSYDLTQPDTDHNYAAIESWKDEPDVSVKGAWQYHVDASDRNSETKDLSVSAKYFCSLLASGITSYAVFYPVVRRTTRLSSPNQGNPCGMIETPPIPHPDGYDWLKTADHSTKAGNGKWERSEEWTGGSYNRALYEIAVQANENLAKAAPGKISVTPPKKTPPDPKS